MPVVFKRLYCLLCLNITLISVVFVVTLLRVVPFLLGPRYGLNIYDIIILLVVTSLDISLSVALTHLYAKKVRQLMQANPISEKRRKGNQALTLDTRYEIANRQ